MSAEVSRAFSIFAFESLNIKKSFSVRYTNFLNKRYIKIRSCHMEVEEQRTPQTLDMKPRSALITGVSRVHGIGRCLVNKFIEQGYKVVGIDFKDLENKINDVRDCSHGPSADLPADCFHFLKADISDPTEAKLAVEEAAQWLGNRINVLINNAARTTTFLSDVDPIKDFAETLAINLNGAYYLSQFVLPYMPPRSSSIIHISSTRALQSEANTAAYSASKAGLCGLTHSQAITLAEKVRVNAVLPGWINTDPSEVIRPEDNAWHPVGRVGTPRDIAEICLFLADEKHSGFITGQQFVVDGGVTKKMIYPE